MTNKRWLNVAQNVFIKAIYKSTPVFAVHIEMKEEQ